MSQLDPTSLAKFRILVAVAMADGVLLPAEEAALLGALGPHADLLPKLLAETIDVDAELARLDAVDRRLVYQSAFALANADGHAQTFEVSLLRKIHPNHAEEGLFGQILGEALDTVLPSRIVAEPDPVRRHTEILEDTFKYSLLAAVAAAIPVPGVGIVADLAEIALQVKLVHDIGLYWGHDLDAKALRTFVTTVAGSAGVRIAVNNLARFVPGWGSAFAAGTSFATTYAIGRAAEAWFANGQDLGDDELHNVFKAARAEGQAEFSHRGADIAAARDQHADALAALSQQLADGVIDRATYEQRVQALR